MRKLTTLAAVLSVASAGVVAVPTFAAAQSYGPPSGTYYNTDPCRDDKHAAANRGTIIGAIGGAVLGSQLSGRGARTEGAVIGAGAGALAGHAIGGHSVRCGGYPQGYRSHPGCRWVNDRYHGRAYSYEVCRRPDGTWRPVR